MTHDEAVDLVAFLMGNSSEEGKQRAAVVLQAAVGLVAAEGGSGWDFQLDQITFTTVADRSEYYKNIGVGLDEDHCLSGNDEKRKIGVIFDVFYSTRALKKRQLSEFRALSIGRTETGEPSAFTAFGNNFHIAPIPGDAYTLKLLVARKITTIEDIPDEFQFAAIYAAKLLGSGVATDAIKENQDYQYLIQAMRNADGSIVFNDQSRAGASLV